MVEVEYLPYQKLVVHEVRKMEVPAFFEFVVSQVEAQKQGGTPVVNWIDGVAYLLSEYMPTPETISENLKGRLHLAAVFFTETSFQTEKRVSVGGRDYTVKLHKADDNPNFVELVKFLKAFKS